MPTAQNTARLREVTLEHPMHRGVTIEVVTVTPDLATEWLGANHGNRNQRPKAIGAYARDIENDAWLFTGESIKFDWNDRLIDGQHRLEAVVKTGLSIQTLVVRNLDPAVQGVIDTAAKRSAANALQFAGVSVQTKDIASIAKVAINYEAGRLRTALDQSLRDVTHTEVTEWHKRNQDVEVAAAFATRVSRKIGSTPAGAGFAVLTLMRIDADATIEFFESSAEMRTRGTGDPRKAMLDAFAKIRSDRRAPSVAESLAVIFRAWNYWRQERDLKLIRSASSDGHGGVTGVSIVEPQ